LDNGGEELVEQLGDRGVGGYLDAVLLAQGSQLRFGGVPDIAARCVGNGIEPSDAAEGALEHHRELASAQLSCAVDAFSNEEQQLLDQLHHPVVVAVGNVELQRGELRIVQPVDPLVAEVLPDFVDAFEAADDEPLEVELGCNAQVEVRVQGVEVGDERSGVGAAVDGLEDWGLHLQPTALVEEFADGGDDAGASAEELPYLGVDDQVQVPPAVALLLVGEGIVADAVAVLIYLLLGGGDRTQGFA
jgi:hypothetical protein